MIFLGICAVVIFLVAFLAFRMSRTILALLGGEPHDAAEAMRKIAGGDLGVDVPLKKDDKTSLMASLKFMQVKLKNLTTMNKIQNTIIKKKTSMNFGTTLILKVTPNLISK